MRKRAGPSHRTGAAIKPLLRAVRPLSASCRGASQRRQVYAICVSLTALRLEAWAQ